MSLPTLDIVLEVVGVCIMLDVVIALLLWPWYRRWLARDTQDDAPIRPRETDDGGKW